MCLGSPVWARKLSGMTSRWAKFHAELRTPRKIDGGVQHLLRKDRDAQGNRLALSGQLHSLSPCPGSGTVFLEHSKEGAGRGVRRIKTNLVG